jgi:haloalkane dehalogenase
MTIPFATPTELFPVEHRFLDLKGARIHYVDEGSGETLLLLHGNPSWSFLYRKIIAALKSDFRCVAIDYPGYGMSDAPPRYSFTPQEHSAVLERFVERLSLSDLTIVVQDWGGPIGLGLATRRPELVRRLIISNTFAWPLGGDWRVRSFSWIFGGPIGRSLTWAFNFTPKFFFARGLAHKPTPEVLAMYLAP